MYWHRVHEEDRPSKLSSNRETASSGKRVNGSRSGPQSGDIVVMREAGSPVRYWIQQLPAAARVSTSSQELAIGLACMFAELHGVDVWDGADHNTLRLLDVYRLQPQAQPR